MEQGECISESYNIIAGYHIRFSPCAHHESIVGGKDGNNIDAFGSEFLQVLNITGEMACGTAGCECT